MQLALSSVLALSFCTACAVGLAAAQPSFAQTDATHAANMADYDECWQKVKAADDGAGAIKTPDGLREAHRACMYARGYKVDIRDGDEEFRPSGRIPLLDASR